MRKPTLLAAALLGVTLLPMTGVRAMDAMESSSGMMDAGMFRDQLHMVKNLFTTMRGNDRLSMASADPLLTTLYEEDNRRNMVKVLGILGKVNRNWKTMNMASMAGGMGDNMAAASGDSKMARYANEADSTAFVRNSVWGLTAQLQADKLNGRYTMINDEMMEKLDAALTRAEGSDFKVASSASSSRLSSRKVEFSEGYQPTTTTYAGAAAPSAAVAEKREFKEVYLQHDNLPARNQVAQATTEETTTTEMTSPVRMGAANESLPKTGGDPGALFALGSGLSGLGLLLRRRRS